MFGGATPSRIDDPASAGRGVELSNDAELLVIQLHAFAVALRAFMDVAHHWPPDVPRLLEAALADRAWWTQVKVSRDVIVHLDSYERGLGGPPGRGLRLGGMVSVSESELLGAHGPPWVARHIAVDRWSVGGDEPPPEESRVQIDVENVAERLDLVLTPLVRRINDSYRDIDWSRVPQ